MNKTLPKIKYPKFSLLVLTFILAYILFKGKDFQPYHNFLLSLGYAGTFLAGILFVYGFTAAPATAILLILVKEQSMFLAGTIAGFGALLGDLFIFEVIRFSFDDEIRKLSKKRIVMHISNHTHPTLKKYLIPVIAGFIIVSPLPDEIGVSLLAASRTISIGVFSIISYVLNTIGIFVILTIGSLI